MTRKRWQRATVGSEELVGALMTRQFVSPRQAVGDAVREVFMALGVCPGAGETAIAWLKFDPQRPIGRLRRSEVAQLAHSAHRYWREKLKEQGMPVAGK
jgi:hypothetical protein